jgi:hypothetical protein
MKDTKMYAVMEVNVTARKSTPSLRTARTHIPIQYFQNTML